MTGDDRSQLALLAAKGVDNVKQIMHSTVGTYSRLKGPRASEQQWIKDKLYYHCGDNIYSKSRGQ